MSALQRLWVVSELYFPEETSTGYFITRIAEGLADRFNVRVICGQPAYSERGHVAAKKETRAGVKIVRVGATNFDKDRLALRLINLVSFSFLVFVHSVRCFRPNDVVLVVTNPPTGFLLIGIAARLRGAKAVLLVHDVYPDVLVPSGALKNGCLRYQFLSAIFTRSLSLFASVVVLGRDMKKLFEAKIGQQDRPMLALIPNWGDVDEIEPSRDFSLSFRRRYQLDAMTIIQFSGNIGRTHDVELVLDVARHLKHRNDISILFIGYGGKARIVEDAIQREDLTNVRFLPRQSRTDLGAMLAASDATIISLVPGMFGLSVPSRMYNVMAAGVPVIAIADAGSELCLMVEENGAGWTPPRDAAALANLIEAIATSEGLADARQRGKRGRDAVVAGYARNKVIDSFASLLLTVGQSR